jgi:hypothetical protein
MNIREIVEEVQKRLEASEFLLSLWELDGGSLEVEQLLDDLECILLDYGIILDRDRFFVALEEHINSGAYYQQLTERIAEDLVSYTVN